MNRILVIDDDAEFCLILSDYLKPEGFEVTSVHDGREGVRRALVGSTEYDLIVLDLMLPCMSGFEVLQCIRPKLDVPVIMLTARNEELDRIIGLEIGADDFLVKPFNSRELVARIRAILRRTRNRPATADAPPENGRIALGDIELDPRTRIVSRDGEQISFTSIEFGLLEMLLRSSGRVVTREQLAVKVLGRNLKAYDRSLDIHLSHIRRKLGPVYNGIERIKTVRGCGYIYTQS
ncbi:MAG: response regulator transcription factor [Syntrophobacter sp.]